jgi:hypothetical protein
LGEAVAGSWQDKRLSEGALRWPEVRRAFGTGRAAELALDQLRWAVNYLYRIRKPTLAAGLERNREHILAQLRRIAQQSSRG